MRLQTLAAQHFRNLQDFRIVPHPRFNILIGYNAQGKTNLLESIYLSANLKSFRTHQNEELVRFGLQEARVVAEVQRGNDTLTLELKLQTRRRLVWVDGQLTRRLTDALGLLQVILFAPEDVALIKGQPSARRSFLDHAVFVSRASYLSILSDYNATLKRRNAVLKNDRRDAKLLEVYSEQLVEHGAEVIGARLELLRQLRPLFNDAFRNIFGAKLEASIRYRASWADQVDLDAPPDANTLRCAMLAAIRALGGDELRRKQSLVGPHRDDLEVLLDGTPAKAHASQGQHRSIVLALKCAEILLLKDRFGLEPILLLDDVSSELDSTRNQQLFSFLASLSGQVFITTTAREHILLDQDQSAWTVHQGGLTPAD
ncbi:MAG: DNA replication/repair protein RecF [Deltaproteobacteria bacterium CG17_big_fil_post_rev_8_21_14_2_50_63_7]|nr:MAG: DNA replication/repair protein RecF [Deltaproteobacteria bacterium CG17_big_fil_post_rev_8_21_14_2_50_63_7]